MTGLREIVEARCRNSVRPGHHITARMWWAGAERFLNDIGDAATPGALHELLREMPPKPAEGLPGVAFWLRKNRLLRESLARIFGRRRGWTLSLTVFAPKMLAGAGARHLSWPDAIFTDAYREPVPRSWQTRPAAAVLHVIGERVALRAAASAFAARGGLRFEVVTNFPSWIEPGAAQIVFTRLPDIAQASATTAFS